VSSETSSGDVTCSELDELSGASQQTGLNVNVLSSLCKIKLSANEHNCVLQCAPSGLIEITAARHLQPNEEVICWFAESYMRNIQSKFSYLDWLSYFYFYYINYLIIIVFIFYAICNRVLF
jgi:hypothetical protein